METDTYDRFALWVWLKLIDWAPNIWILCFFFTWPAKLFGCHPNGMNHPAIWPPDKPFSWFKCHEVGVLFHNRRFRSWCDHQSLVAMRERRVAGLLDNLDSPHWLLDLRWQSRNHGMQPNQLGINVTRLANLAGQHVGIKEADGPLIFSIEAVPIFR